MPVMEIPIRQWLPDQPDFRNPGCEIANNVYPDTQGFRPFPGPASTDLSLSGVPRGAALFYNTNGDGVVVGGTDDTLFVAEDDIVETTGLTPIGDEGAWDFAQFNDFIIATGPNNPPQYLDDIDTDDTWSDLPGSPPNATKCARVGDFLMLGDVDGNPNRIQWSSFNSPATDWTESRLTQAGFALLPKEYGKIQRIVGGRSALVLQERGITRLSYVGPPLVWSTQTISDDRGALTPYSVVSVGYYTFFIARDGFYVSNGSGVQSIGNERVNRWFFDNVNQSKLHLVNATVDWQNECVIWAFPDAKSEISNRMIIYSWALQKWSTATVESVWTLAYPPAGVSIDDMDALYGTLDQIPVSLDSAEFKTKDSVLAMFTPLEPSQLVDVDDVAILDTDGSPIIALDQTKSSLSTFNGENLVASITTGELQPAQGRRTFVSEATPIVEADDMEASVTIVTRDNLNGSGNSTTAPVGWGGFAPVRAEGKKVSVRIDKPSGAWENISAVQIMYDVAGHR